MSETGTEVVEAAFAEWQAARTQNEKWQAAEALRRHGIAVPMGPVEPVKNVEYRPISDYPHYLVATDGTVWATRDTSGRPLPTGQRRRLNGSVTKYGYVSIGFWAGKNSKTDKRYVHHLVMSAFVGPRPDGMHVCHKNGVSTDNRLDNLYYGTAHDNARDKIRHGRQPRGVAHGRSKMSEQDILAIHEELLTGASLRSLAAKYRMSSNGIREIEAGRNWGWLTGRSGDAAGRCHEMKPYRDGKLNAHKFGSQGRIALLEAIIDEANMQCPSCGLFMSRMLAAHCDRTAELDHKDPSAGDLVHNIQVLCRKCNRLKGGFVCPENVIGAWSESLLAQMDALDLMLSNPGWSAA